VLSCQLSPLLTQPLYSTTDPPTSQVSSFLLHARDVGRPASARVTHRGVAWHLDALEVTHEPSGETAVFRHQGGWLDAANGPSALLLPEPEEDDEYEDYSFYDDDEYEGGYGAAAMEADDGAAQRNDDDDAETRREVAGEWARTLASATAAGAAFAAANQAAAAAASPQRPQPASPVRAAGRQRSPLPPPGTTRPPRSRSRSPPPRHASPPAPAAAAAAPAVSVSPAAAAIQAASAERSQAQGQQQQQLPQAGAASPPPPPPPAPTVQYKVVIKTRRNPMQPAPQQQRLSPRGGPMTGGDDVSIALAGTRAQTGPLKLGPWVAQGAGGAWVFVVEVSGPVGLGLVGCGVGEVLRWWRGFDASAWWPPAKTTSQPTQTQKLQGPDIGAITSANLELHAGEVEDAWQVASVEVTHTVTGQAVRFAFVGWVDSEESDKPAPGARAPAHSHPQPAAAAAAGSAHLQHQQPLLRQLSPCGAPAAPAAAPPNVREYEVAISTSNLPGAGTECEVGPLPCPRARADAFRAGERPLSSVPAPYRLTPQPPPSPPPPGLPLPHRRVGRHHGRGAAAARLRRRHH
jgi:hypothetical protein